MESNVPRLYFGARKTCLEMIIDRGYLVPTHLSQLTEKEFNLSSSHHMELTGITDPKQQLPVIVKLTKQVEKTSLKEEIGNFVLSTFPQGSTKLKDFELSKVSGVRLIIIYDASIFPGFEEEYLDHRFVEVFDVRHMYINPIRHIYQPKFRLMDESEIIKMLKRYEADVPQPSRLMLPGICIDDPINRYYRGRPPSKDYKGDVYEITREGVNIFYRRVTSKRINK